MRRLSLALLLGLAALSGSPARAAGTEDFAVQPHPLRRDGVERRSFFVTVSGPSYRDAVLVTNRSAEPLTVRLYAADAAQDDAGNWTIAPSGRAPAGAGRWVRLSRSRLGLPAGRSEVVTFSVRPGGVAASPAHAAVVVEPVSPSSGGITVVERAAILVRTDAVPVALSAPAKSSGRAGSHDAGEGDRSDARGGRGWLLLLVPGLALGWFLFFILWKRRDDEEDEDQAQPESAVDDSTFEVGAAVGPVPFAADPGVSAQPHAPPKRSTKAPTAARAGTKRSVAAARRAGTAGKPAAATPRAQPSRRRPSAETARRAGAATSAGTAPTRRARTPARGTAARGTAARGTPARGTPARGTPARGTPARGTPARGTPARGTPARGTPARGTQLRDGRSARGLVRASRPVARSSRARP